MADQPGKPFEVTGFGDKTARTIEAQAKRYNVCNSYVRRLIKDGHLAFFQRGGRGVKLIYDTDMDAVMSPPAEAKKAG